MRTTAVAISPSELAGLECVVHALLTNIREAHCKYGSAPKLRVDVALYDSDSKTFRVGFNIGPRDEDLQTGWAIGTRAKVIEGMRAADYVELVAHKVANIVPGWTSPDANLVDVGQNSDDSFVFSIQFD